MHGSANIQANGNAAHITLGKHTLIIEQERVLLDGQERGRLPADAKKVAIEVSAGNLTVQADGKPVLSADVKP